MNLTVFSEYDDLRWRHNGGEVITSLNGKKTYTIASATVEHAGIYECHLQDRRREGKQAIFQLIVRGLFDFIANKDLLRHIQFVLFIPRLNQTYPILL